MYTLFNLVGVCTSRSSFYAYRSWECDKVESYDPFDTNGSTIVYYLVSLLVHRVGPLSSVFSGKWCTDKIRYYYDSILTSRLYVPVVSSFRHFLKYSVVWWSHLYKFVWSSWEQVRYTYNKCVNLCPVVSRTFSGGLFGYGVKSTVCDHAMTVHYYNVIQINDYSCIVVFDLLFTSRYFFNVHYFKCLCNYIMRVMNLMWVRLDINYKCLHMYLLRYLCIYSVELFGESGYFSNVVDKECSIFMPSHVCGKQSRRYFRTVSCLHDYRKASEFGDELDKFYKFFKNVYMDKWDELSEVYGTHQKSSSSIVAWPNVEDSGSGIAWDEEYLFGRTCRNRRFHEEHISSRFPGYEKAFLGIDRLMWLQEKLCCGQLLPEFFLSVNCKDVKRYTWLGWYFCKRFDYYYRIWEDERRCHKKIELDHFNRVVMPLYEPFFTLEECRKYIPKISDKQFMWLLRLFVLQFHFAGSGYTQMLFNRRAHGFFDSDLSLTVERSVLFNFKQPISCLKDFKHARIDGWYAESFIEEPVCRYAWRNDWEGVPLSPKRRRFSVVNHVLYTCLMYDCSLLGSGNMSYTKMLMNLSLSMLKVDFVSPGSYDKVRRFCDYFDLHPFFNGFMQASLGCAYGQVTNWREFCVALDEAIDRAYGIDAGSFYACGEKNMKEALRRHCDLVKTKIEGRIVDAEKRILILFGTYDVTLRLVENVIRSGKREFVSDLVNELYFCRRELFSGSDSRRCMGPQGVLADLDLCSSFYVTGGENFRNIEVSRTLFCSLWYEIMSYGPSREELLGILEGTDIHENLAAFLKKEVRLLLHDNRESYMKHMYNVYLGEDDVYSGSFAGGIMDFGLYRPSRMLRMMQFI